LSLKELHAKCREHRSYGCTWRAHGSFWDEGFGTAL